MYLLALLQDPKNEDVLANKVALAPHLSRAPERLQEVLQ
jgi:hypothetical protein